LRRIGDDNFAASAQRDPSVIGNAAQHRGMGDDSIKVFASLMAAKHKVRLEHNRHPRLDQESQRVPF
jgi:hypothetical protein